MQIKIHSHDQVDGIGEVRLPDGHPPRTHRVGDHAEDVEGVNQRNVPVVSGAAEEAEGDEQGDNDGLGSRLSKAAPREPW